MRVPGCVARMCIPRCRWYAVFHPSHRAHVCREVLDPRRHVVHQLRRRLRVSCGLCCVCPRVRCMSSRYEPLLATATAMHVQLLWCWRHQLILDAAVCETRWRCCAVFQGDSALPVRRHVPTAPLATSVLRHRRARHRRRGCVLRVGSQRAARRSAATAPLATPVLSAPSQRPLPRSCAPQVRCGCYARSCAARWLRPCAHA